MNFTTMEYFMAVAAKRNITKAAEELHITQQTLSAHIATLEKELACQLFVRSNPLELTYAGEVFLRHATGIWESYQSMWNEFNDLTNNQRGKLLVGVDYARSHAIMPRIIEAFQSEYPNIEVRLSEGSDRSLHSSLMNKDIDLAIARFSEYTPGIEVRDFYREEIVMLMPAYFLGEKNAENFYLKDLSEFINYPFVLGSFHSIAGQIGRNMIMKTGFQPIVKAQSDNLETLLSLCTRGIGICFCPKSLVHASLTEDQLQQMLMYHFDEESNYPLRFGFRKTSYQWKMISEFIRIALKEKDFALY